MGFLGSIASSFCGALSAVGSAFCSGISGICSAIGGALFSGAGGVASIVAGIVGTAIDMTGISTIFRAVGAIVGRIAEFLGLKEPEEKPEELGMKAEEADKKPEDFDSTEAYIAYLREEVELDRMKIKGLSDTERVKYAAVGTGLYIKGIEEKYGIQAPGEFWRTVAELNLKGDEVRAYIEAFKEKGVESMKDMSDYIKGKPLESNTEPGDVSSAILDGLKQIYPEMTDQELMEKFTALTMPSGE